MTADDVSYLLDDYLKLLTVKYLVQRANMLSDEPPKAKSVFDFISKKNQERIANAKAAGQKVASTETTSSAPPPTTLIDLRVPELDKTIAEAALKGFMPYADNQGKQARYRLFLQAAAGEKSEEGVFAPRATADRADELQKELDDFKRSAMVFKPMSRAMASRFTSGDAKKTAQDMKMPHQAGLAFVSASTSSTTPAPELEEEKQPPEEETDPVLIAVRSGMFGALTRNTTEFYPCKLLCKRFGVRQPHPTGGGGPSAGGDEDEEGAGPSKENEKDLLNKSTMDDLRQQSGYVQSVAPASKQASEAGSALAPLQPNKSIGLGEDDAQGADILTYERPSIDIFKAIFEDLDDADEEFAEQKSSDKAPEQTETIAAIVNAAPSQAQKANLEPVSFTDFKPTFIRRAGDPSTTAEGEANNSSEPKKKKKKKKDKGAALSFAMEDGDDPEAAPALPKKEKRKKSKTGAVAVGDEDSRKKPRIEEAEVEDEWVEKPSAAPVIPTARARARAADLF